MNRAPQGERRVQRGHLREHRVRGGAIPFLLASLLCASPLTAQSTETCRLNVSRAATIGDEGDGAISYPLTFMRTTDGRFLTVGVAAQSEVMVFGASGSLVQRFGRSGRGPTDFLAVNLIHRWTADSVAVWDPGNRRVKIYPSELAGPRLKTVAVLARRGVILPDGTLIVNGQVRVAEGRGMALHRIEGDAEPGLSFDSSHSVGIDRPARRALAVSRSGGFWAARQDQYHVTRWSAEGELLQEVRRAPSWFPGDGEYGWSSSRPDDPPGPGVIDVVETGGGDLGVVIHVPASDWRSAMGVQRGMYGRQVAGPTDENRLWDTVIEQIDPATGRVVGSVRLDAASLGWADAHHVYHYREDDYGRPFIDVWRVGWCGQARSVP